MAEELANSQRIEGIRKLLAAPVVETAPSNESRDWRSDCDYLLARFDELQADLKLCAPHITAYAQQCEACQGSGEFLDNDDDGPQPCQHCKPLWELEARINPSPPPLPLPLLGPEYDDDIPF